MGDSGKGKLIGAGAGAAASFPAGMIVGRLSGGDMATLQWLLDKGTPALLLLAVFVLLAVCAQLFNRVLHLEKERADDRERLLRESMTIVRKQSKLHTLTIELLRRLRVSDDTIQEHEEPDEEDNLGSSSTIEATPP